MARYGSKREMNQVVSLLVYLWLIGAIVLATLALKSTCVAFGSRVGHLRWRANCVTEANAAQPVEASQADFKYVRKYGSILAFWIFDGLFILMFFFR